MIELRLSVDVLGNTRFAYSPLSEVASSLRVFGAGNAGYVLQRWIREVRGSLQATELDLLCAVAPPGRFAPDFLFSWSADPKTTIDTQLEELAASSMDAIRADLEAVWSGRPPPAALTQLLDEGAGGCRRLADAIWDYWQAAIAPYWSRIRSVLDDDVAYRARRVLSGGLYDMLADVHPEVTLHNRVLLIDKPQHSDATYPGAELTLLPSVFVWPDLIMRHDPEGRIELVYGARGIGRVWEGLASVETSTDVLGALLGRTRAVILKRLAVPMTTTQLARDLGQSPGTVSAHLSVLRGNGLLTSWRSGRSVLYRRTPLAASIIAAGDAGTGRAGLA